MIYGTPIIHVDDDRTDRIGIRTLIMSQLWQASRWPLGQDELDAESPPPPAVPGGVIFIGQQTRRQRGSMRTTWTFEGINGNGKSVTFKGRTNSLDYQFEPGFSDKSLLLLPNIKTKMDQFGGYVIDGRLVWPPEIPETNTGSGMKKQDKAGKVNPFFGRETYLSMEGTYHFRYADTTYGQAFSGVRHIFKTGSLPGDPPTGIGDRDWLKAPPKVIRRGPVFDITEVYWLSEVGGWPEELYGTGGLASGEDGAAAGSGLSTGGVSTGSL